MLSRSSSKWEQRLRLVGSSIPQKNYPLKSGEVCRICRNWRLWRSMWMLKSMNSVSVQKTNAEVGRILLVRLLVCLFWFNNYHFNVPPTKLLIIPGNVMNHNGNHNFPQHLSPQICNLSFQERHYIGKRRSLTCFLIEPLRIWLPFPMKSTPGRKFFPPLKHLIFLTVK